METPRVAIGMISSGMIHHDYAMNLMGMITHTKVKYDIIGAKSCLVSKNRRICAEAMMQSKATHLLFIDTDMKFPLETMEHLLSHDKPVVAANCVTRKHPVKFTADFPTAEASTGLQQTKRAGTAVMLIKREVFEKIAKPWFTVGYNPMTNLEIGEDYWFCQQCEKQNIPIYIDHDISKAIYHLGLYPYGVEDFVE